MPENQKKEKTKSNLADKTLVLLDSHAILHRAYHALPDFASSKGEPTGALYGLSALLLKIIGDIRPDYIFACFDLPSPTYRHQAYDGYKSGRKKSDPSLVEQIKKSYAVFEAFGIPVYSKEGFEADDMLGTIVEKVISKKTDIKNSENKSGQKVSDVISRVVVASGDMDTLQLVSGKKVTVYTLKKGIKDTIIYDEESVIKRFGFGPDLLPDFKGLRGDPSDNIIGIAGIGEKTATTLITTFGSIENIYKVLKKDKEKIKSAGVSDRIIGLLEEGEDEALFSKMLATIRRDAPIDVVLPEKKWIEEVDKEKVGKLFKELEFRSLTERFNKVYGELSGAVGGAVNGSKNDQTIIKKELTKKEKQEIADTQEQSLDQTALKETAVALWVMDSNITNPTLNDILFFAGGGLSDDIGEEKNDKDKILKIKFERAREYIFSEIKRRGEEKVFETIEKPLISIIEKMHRWGIKIDTDYLKKLGKEYHKNLKKLEVEIWTAAGQEFNVNSPKQLGEILFEKMALKTLPGVRQKKTAGGAMSTKESELEKLRDVHPIIDHILKYRELQKLLSTYIDTIPELVATDGRLHAYFLQAGSTTGRMSSQDPNLQNIPIKTELGRKIRHAFVAEKGFVLCAFDYSQIELRIAAFLSGDEKLIEVFKKGEDVHTSVAAEVFEVTPAEVTKEMRRKAKVINFGILYGMGVSALKINLGSTREEAQQFYQKYFQTFSGLASYLDYVKAEAARQGYTETLYGRKRWFEGIKSKLPFIRAAAERMAINAPIQGTGADIVKLAMIETDRFITESGYEGRARMLLQVHDELVYEIEEDLVEDLSIKIKEIMSTVVSTKDTKGVPIIANVAVGKNWGEMEK